MPRRRKYPEELYERGVRLALESGRPISHIARDIGLPPETLRKRVRQVEADEGLRPDLLSTEEGEQIKQLRKEVFGVVPRDFDGRLPDRQRWTSERVEAELRGFCAGRETWPTFREFQAADRYALYRAAGRYGGMKHWRECITLRTSSAR